VASNFRILESMWIEKGVWMDLEKYGVIVFEELK
jgi:hypothetical protein